MEMHVKTFSFRRVLVDCYHKKLSPSMWQATTIFFFFYFLFRCSKFNLAFALKRRLIDGSYEL